MKPILSNGITLFGLFIIFILSNSFFDSEYEFWSLLKSRYVLNIGLASIGIGIGYFVRDYRYILVGASFALGIYCLVFFFDPNLLFMSQFFLALYTIFLTFSVFANLCRHYIDWILREV